MSVEARFKDLARELEAQQNRVRQLLPRTHALTDGEWKESVLRTVLERHLPRRIVVGRGFIRRGDEQSSQIDVLLYDDAAPLLHRDGDIVVVTPDAVRGVIEVKTTASRRELPDAFKKLAHNARIAAPPDMFTPGPFIGLFAYSVEGDEETSPDWVLPALRDNDPYPTGRAVGHVCLGPAHFVHYWSRRPDDWFELEPYRRWHLYKMPDLAPGYFISNVIEAIAPESVAQNRSVWFPEDSKEALVVGAIARHPWEE